MGGYYTCLLCNKLKVCKLNEPVALYCDECLSKKYDEKFRNMNEYYRLREDAVVREMLSNCATPARYVHKHNQEATGMTKEKELAFWKDIRTQISYREYEDSAIVYRYRKVRDELDSFIRSIDEHYREPKDD